MSVIVGATNTDGTGSAANLTKDNGEWIDLNQTPTYQNNQGMGGNWRIEQGNVTVSSSWDHYGQTNTSFTNTGVWNEAGLKEIYIDSDDMEKVDGNYLFFTIKNFVDVYLNFSEDLSISNFSMIDIIDAKRGDIDTTALNDQTTLNITPYSNGASWSNLFNVTTGDYADRVTFYTQRSDYEGNTSQWTEFDVSLGGGNDTFIYSLSAAASDEQTRYVDGGEGVDTLYWYTNSDDLTFVNFEYVYTYAGQSRSLSLNQTILDNNNADEAGLTVVNFDLEFSDEYDSIAATAELDDSGNETGYYSVVVTYDDDTYTVISNHIDDDWLLAS